MGDVIVVRTTTPDRRPTSDEEAHLLGLDYLDRLARSDAFKHAPEGIRERIAALKSVAEALKTTQTPVLAERSGLHAISSLVVDGANIVISTANSPDIETLVEAREQFDWVIIEEAAKATGPELVGPLMLRAAGSRSATITSCHRLRLIALEILGDFGLLTAALNLAPAVRWSLDARRRARRARTARAEPCATRESAKLALRLLEPFRTFAEEDERRLLANSSHRPISAMLTEQRRMDPAIARIISEAFYKGSLRRRPSARKRPRARFPPSCP